MKKFISRMLTLTLVIALAITFTACSFDVGGGVTTNSGDSTGNQTSEVTKTPEELATEEFEAKMAEVDAVINSIEYDDEGNVVNNIYTKSSYEEFNAYLSQFSYFTPEGKTAEEIYEAISVIESTFSILETTDSVIDQRIVTAIDKLALYQVDEYNNEIWYNIVDDMYVKCETDANGDYIKNENSIRKPDKGVDKIDYNTETNKATFILSDKALDTLLLQFVNTNVLTVFNKDFGDLTRIQFDVFVVVEGETEPSKQTIVMTAEQSSGMYLAAGLIAVCAGGDFTQGFYNFSKTGNLEGIQNLLKGVQDETYSLIAGKGCTAKVTFENDEYVRTLDFSVYFQA